MFVLSLIGKHGQVAIPNVLYKDLQKQILNIKKSCATEQIFNLTPNLSAEPHCVRHMVKGSTIKEYRNIHPSRNRDFFLFLDAVKDALPAYLHGLLDKG